MQNNDSCCDLKKIVSRKFSLSALHWFKYLTRTCSTTGVDFILDNIGASYLQKNLESLNFDGRLFLIGFMGGTVAEINLASLLVRRLTVQGNILEPCNMFLYNFSSFLFNHWLLAVHIHTYSPKKIDQGNLAVQVDIM